MKIVKKINDRQVVIEGDDKESYLFNVVQKIDTEKYQIEKWLLLENKGFDAERLRHLQALERELHADKEWDEVIDEKVARIDALVESISVQPKEV